MKQTRIMTSIALVNWSFTQGIIDHSYNILITFLKHSFLYSWFYLSFILKSCRSEVLEIIGVIYVASLVRGNDTRPGSPQAITTTRYIDNFLTKENIWLRLNWTDPFHFHLGCIFGFTCNLSYILIQFTYTIFGSRTL